MSPWTLSIYRLFLWNGGGGWGLRGSAADMVHPWSAWPLSSVVRVVGPMIACQQKKRKIRGQACFVGRGRGRCNFDEDALCLKRLTDSACTSCFCYCLCCGVVDGMVLFRVLMAVLGPSEAYIDCGNYCNDEEQKTA